MEQKKIKIGTHLIEKYPDSIPFQKVLYRLPAIQRKNYMDSLTVILETDYTRDGRLADNFIVDFSRAGVKNPKYVLERSYIRYEAKDFILQLMGGVLAVRYGFAKYGEEEVTPHRPFLNAVGITVKATPLDEEELKQIRHRGFPESMLVDEKDPDFYHFLLVQYALYSKAVSRKGRRYNVTEDVSFSLLYSLGAHRKRPSSAWAFYYNIESEADNIGRTQSDDGNPIPDGVSSAPEKEVCDFKIAPQREYCYPLSQEKLEQMLLELERKMLLWYRDELEIYPSELKRKNSVFIKGDWD